MGHWPCCFPRLWVCDHTAVFLNLNRDLLVFAVQDYHCQNTHTSHCLIPYRHSFSARRYFCMPSLQNAFRETLEPAVCFFFCLSAGLRSIVDRSSAYKYPFETPTAVLLLLEVIAYVLLFSRFVFFPPWCSNMCLCTHADVSAAWLSVAHLCTERGYFSVYIYSWTFLWEKIKCLSGYVTTQLMFFLSRIVFCFSIVFRLA